MIKIYENAYTARQERIYIEFKDRVARYVRGKVGNEHDSEDVVSDVFVKVFNGLSDFDENKASLSTWIFTITRNAVIDYFRASKRLCELPEELYSEDDTEQNIINTEMLERLADALERLNERERNIIVLHYYGGRTLKDIAEAMGISYSYTKLLHGGALKVLRKHIDE